MKRLWSIFWILLFTTTLFSQTSPDASNEQSPGEKYIYLESLNITSLGDFKESWESASGFNAGYGIIYADKGSLFFQTGYKNFKANAAGGVSEGSTFRIIPLQVGARYFISVDRFRPFLMAMTGVNIVQQDWATADTSFNTTEGKLNFQVGLGLDVVLFSGLQLEVVARYNSHLLEPSIPYNITGLEYNIGLVWRFSPANRD